MIHKISHKRLRVTENNTALVYNTPYDEEDLIDAYVYSRRYMMKSKVAFPMYYRVLCYCGIILSILSAVSLLIKYYIFPLYVITWLVGVIITIFEVIDYIKEIRSKHE